MSSHAVLASALVFKSVIGPALKLQTGTRKCVYAYCAIWGVIHTLCHANLTNFQDPLPPCNVSVMQLLRASKHTDTLHPNPQSVTKCMDDSEIVWILVSIMVLFGGKGLDNDIMEAHNTQTQAFLFAHMMRKIFQPTKILKIPRKASR